MTAITTTPAPTLDPLPHGIDPLSEDGETHAQDIGGLYSIEPALASIVEAHIVKTAAFLTQHDTNGYKSGDWESMPVNTGWYFSLREARVWRVVNTDNYTDVTTSSKVLSLSAFVIAISEMIAYCYERLKNSGSGSAVEAFVEEMIWIHKTAMSGAADILTPTELEAFYTIVD